MRTYTTKALPLLHMYGIKSKCALNDSTFIITESSWREGSRNNPETKESYELNFTVCVPPLFSHFDGVNRIVEFIEIHKKFGVGKFVMYNTSIGSNASLALEHYTREGYVDVLPWKIPANTNAWYFAQVASITDCLYRYMYRSRFITFMDLDEVLVPKMHGSLSDLIKFIKFPFNNTKNTETNDSSDNIDVTSSNSNDKINNNNDNNNGNSNINSNDKSINNYNTTSNLICAFAFQSVFFRLNVPDNPLNSSCRSLYRKYKIITFLKTNRDAIPYPHPRRSKCVVNPRMVDIMSIHTVSKPLEGCREVYVPFDLAAIHHYRYWYEGSTDNLVTDFTISTLVPELPQIILNVRQKLKQGSETEYP